MATGSGYSKEFLNSSNIPNIQHKEDIKTYVNEGAELGVSERNAEYAEHKDILLNEIQPYDNNAKTEIQPYDNNAEPMHPEILFKIRRRCRLFSYILSMLSTAVGVGCVIVICLISFCKLPGLKCIIDPPPPPPPPPPGCIVPRGTACNVHYRLSLRNATEIRLIKETLISKVTFVNGTSLVNMEESLFDQNNKITVNATFIDTYIAVSVQILDTQCNHHGNYSILAISDENGFEEAFFSVNVITHCPCQIDLNVASNGEINCYFPNGDNTTILIQKVSSDMQTVLLNETEIIRPFSTSTASGFTASWSNDGLNIKLKLGIINCSHEGNYNFNVIMNGTSTMYDVYLHVIDYPQTPVIQVASAGVIEGKGGEILCKAMTGCRKAQFEFELSGTNNDIWDVWRETTPPLSTLTNLGWETNMNATIQTGQEVNVDRRKLRCSYMSNRHVYTSPGLCIGVIPANFCQNDKRQCDYQHPYLCNKYISCPSPTNPLERPCSIVTELHFVPTGDCGGHCDWPEKANCSIKDHCG